MKEGWEAEKLVDICKIQYGYPFDSKQFIGSRGRFY